MPSSSEQHCQWRDVQHVLKQAADELQPGELLHTESFSLFEAMSAIEIGDPKMDAGLDTANAPTADELVQQGHAPDELSRDQVLAVMDQLFACQASWHSGNSLPQTVFTCLYLLRPDRYQCLVAVCEAWLAGCELLVIMYRTSKQAALSAVCEAVRATVSAARTIVMHGAVCEVSCLPDASRHQQMTSTYNAMPCPL